MIPTGILTSGQVPTNKAIKRSSRKGHLHTNGQERIHKHALCQHLASPTSQNTNPLGVLPNSRKLFVLLSFYPILVHLYYGGTTYRSCISTFFLLFLEFFGFGKHRQLFTFVPVQWFADRKSRLPSSSYNTFFLEIKKITIL